MKEYNVSALEKLISESNKLWNTHDLHNGLTAMLDASIALLSADFGNIQILDSEKQVLRIAAQRGFKKEFLEFFHEVSTTDDSACGRSLRAKKRTIIKDITKDKRYAPYLGYALRAGYKAVQSTPLINSAGKPLGMLSTHFKKPHVPTKEELDMLDLYARQAASFIERVYLEENLRKKEKQKDDFINMVSHELKTPLTSAKLLAQLLLKQYSKDTYAKQLNNKMTIQIDRLTLLVSELLDVTKLEQGKLQLRNQRFFVNEVIQELVEDLQPLCEQRLTIKKNAKIYVYADKERVRQVLTNLLTNAMKYSPENTSIIIASNKKYNAIEISVQDFGKGIPDDEQGHIFERFYQNSQNRGDTHPGMGLGLFIAKELITRMKGKIWFESTLGKGSTFYINLPLKAKID